MRRFEHKITGYIATETNSEKNYKVSEPKNFTIPKWIVEDSEDWEEVKEFPKIISFRNKCNNVTFNLCENGKYSSTNSSGYFPKEHHLELDHFEIYQVAVSENEIFTLGDRVTYNYRANYAPWIIDNFFIRTDGKILARSKANSICEIVSEIKKAPEVLFVTEDCIEIFKGDKFYYISIREPNPACYSGCAQEGSAMNTNYKYFSTVEAAEKYIDENKSIYSKKQIKEAIESSFVRETYILDTPYCQIDKFKEDIFKQKLGL